MISPETSLTAGLAFGVLAVVGPGVGLMRLLRLPIDPALVLPLGLLCCAGAWGLCLGLGSPWLFPLLVIGLLACGLVRREPWRLAEGAPLRGALAPIAVLVVVLVMARWGANQIGSGGELSLERLSLHDNAVHVATTWELSHAWPPQVPGLSGVSFSYHFGADLVRAAALRWAGVDPYQALTRLEPALGAIALVLAMRATCAALGASPLVTALAPWTLLATDLSFLLAGWRPEVWWADLLPANLLFALVMANNAVVPALAMLLGTLVCLRRFLGGEGHGWLLLAALLGFGVPCFKVFFGAQLLAGLVLAWLLAPAARRALVAPALACLLALALLTLQGGGRRVEVGWDPLASVRATREVLDEAELEGVGLLAWSGLWLAAALGLRCWGVLPAVHALASRQAVPVALSALALSGWPAALLLRIELTETLHWQKAANEAHYFSECSGAVLWIFALTGLAPLLSGGGPRAGLAWLLAAALSLPATVQFFIRKAAAPREVVPAGVMRTMAALARSSRPGDVVLMPPRSRYPPSPLLFGRRVVYSGFFLNLTRFATPDELEARRETVLRFFATSDAAEARAILRKLGASFVYLRERDRLRFDAGGLLALLHEEPEARLYRVLGD